jgi:pimeloyl-ACP methyl ester carboxylesterase
MATRLASLASALPLVLCLIAATDTRAAPPRSARPSAEAQLFAPKPCELRGTQGVGRVAAECGSLRVPENPAAPDGATIELFVVRIRSLGQEPAADAFTIINGGPGASSVDLYVDLRSAFAPVLRERDIVIVDQRGTGRSARLDCETPAESVNTFDDALVRDATRRCLDTLKGDPRFYTTSVAVADLERVRNALGYPRLNLYGVSYGTRVAQHYLRRYPDAVRSVVLDGVLPPSHALGPDVALNSEHALAALFERCAADPACHERFPDPSAQFQRLAARLKAAPLALELPDARTGRSATLPLGYGHLAATVRLLNYAPESAALVPLLLDEADAHANWTPLALHAQRIEQELGDAMSVAMHNSVVCTEDVPYYEGLDAVWPELERSYLGTDQVRMLQTICNLWPRGIADADLRAPLATDTPVLLLSGEFDPITPPEYAERATAGLANHRLVVARGQGHGIAGRGCVPELIGDFVRNGKVEGLDTECVGRMAAQPFFVDLMGPGA